MKKVYCIGIGGIGLSGLARMLGDFNYEVSGSDIEPSPTTARLEQDGINVAIGHASENLPDECDVVIYSHAIPEKNAERQEAKRRGIKQMTYPEALGYFTQDKTVIAVTGTHGKTTTTAMLAKIFIDAGLDPTVIVGSEIFEWDHRNYRHGSSEYVILEACEHKRSFLHLNPMHAILTNVDLDHLDYYQDKEDYDHAFSEFVSRIPESGSVVYFEDDKSAAGVVKSGDCAQVAVAKQAIDELGLEVGVPGQHNRENALLALVLAENLGVDTDSALESLENFIGTGRRLEEKGSISDTVFYDDYGHHPKEVAATLQALREEYPEESILCIYQPHQFSRTQFFLDEFPASFEDADAVIVPGIYEARDLDEGRGHEISAGDFVEKLVQGGRNAVFESNIDQLKKAALEHDVVVVMGAGDVWKLTEEMMG